MLPYLIVLFASFSSLITMNYLRPSSESEAVNQVYIAPSKSTKHFLFGYKENFVDSLWLRLIQDLDVCDQGRMAMSGIKKEDQEISGQNRLANCRFGWGFRMLDVITDFAPKFRIAHSVGATILSVLVDDIEGASVIFDRAVKNFPNDWSILYRAAYHALYEEENSKKAADLFVRAGKNGAPQWVFALAAKLYSKTGRLLAAKITLESILKELPHDSKYRPRIEQRLVEVNKSFENIKTENK